MPHLVFDCETVPNHSVYAQLLNLPAETPLPALQTAWETAGRPFKAELQALVSCAAAWIADDGTLQRLTTLGPASEQDAVTQFFTTVRQHHPILVGWNTSGFDLPVLLTRALVYGVDVGDFYRYHAPYDGYLKRYSDKDHRDLMDLQAFFRATTPLSLDEMAALLGIPGKLGTDGSHVLDLFHAGDVDAIHAYCQHDVLTTAVIYRFLAVHRGWWTAEHGQRFDDSVHTFLAAQTQTHWDAWQAGWSSTSPDGFQTRG